MIFIHIFDFVQDKLRLGTKNKLVYFILLSACIIFVRYL